MTASRFSFSFSSCAAAAATTAAAAAAAAAEAWMCMHLQATEEKTAEALVCRRDTAHAGAGEVWGLRCLRTSCMRLRASELAAAAAFAAAAASCAACNRCSSCSMALQTQKAPNMHARMHACVY